MLVPPADGAFLARIITFAAVEDTGCSPPAPLSAAILLLKASTGTVDNLSMKPARSVRIRHDLLGVGWANAALIIDGTVTIISASSRSDALGDLVTAARLLAEGQQDARCTWEGERHETRWVFNWRSDGLRLRILEFGPNERFWDDKDGKVRVDVVVPRVELTRAVLLAAEEVLYHHGPQGYRAMGVTHAFPSEAMERLREALPASEEAA